MRPRVDRRTEYMRSGGAKAEERVKRQRRCRRKL